MISKTCSPSTRIARVAEPLRPPPPLAVRAEGSSVAPASARATANRSAAPSVTVKLISTSPSLDSSRTSKTVASVALISSKPKVALIAKSSSCSLPHVASAPSVMSTASSSPTRSDMVVAALSSSVSGFSTPRFAVQSQHLPSAIVPSQKPHDDESVAHQPGKLWYNQLG